MDWRTWSIVIIISRLLLLLLFLTSSVGAQQPEQTTKQFWPEIDVYLPVNEKFRGFLTARARAGIDNDQRPIWQIGAHLDYFWKKRWTLRAGYRYSFPSRDQSSEKRILTEETFSQPFANRFVLHNRMRQEFRWLNNNDFSMRFRNRVMLQRDFSVSRRTLSPYCNVEIMYDTRFNTFNRYRLAVGTQILLRKRESFLLNLRRQRVFDVYYLWQGDSRSQPKHVQAIGVTVGLHF